MARRNRPTGIHFPNGDAANPVVGDETQPTVTPRKVQLQLLSTSKSEELTRIHPEHPGGTAFLLLQSPDSRQQAVCRLSAGR